MWLLIVEVAIFVSGKHCCLTFLFLGQIDGIAPLKSRARLLWGSAVKASVLICFAKGANVANNNNG